MQSICQTIKISLILTLSAMKITVGELRPEEYKRLCYFNNWSQGRPKVAQLWPEQVIGPRSSSSHSSKRYLSHFHIMNRCLLLPQVDPWVCTHLLYSFYYITGTKLKPTAKPKNDEDLLKRLKLLR